jgi:release factor glutamine methyltransferase
MVLKKYKSQFTTALSTIYDEKEIESFFYITLEALHQLKRIDLALQPDFEIDVIQLFQWETILSQLKQQKPIQYILGETLFYELPFFVNENTLIPRPETEELVAWIIKKNSNLERSKDLRILDIGTGSGCIAVALAKNIPNAKVFAIDVSEKALATANKNAQRNQVDVTFLHKNILETNSLEMEFDIVVSNPPYVRHLEKTEISKNVLEYEPHLALFVEDHDALLFYRKISQLAQKNLVSNGQLYFEINQYLAKEMQELLENFNFKNIELKKDIYGNDRMSFCNV